MKNGIQIVVSGDRQIGKSAVVARIEKMLKSEGYTDVRVTDRHANHDVQVFFRDEHKKLKEVPIVIKEERATAPKVSSR